jgi:hypothetical protein
MNEREQKKFIDEKIRKRIDKQIADKLRTSTTETAIDKALRAVPASGMHTQNTDTDLDPTFEATFLKHADVDDTPVDGVTTDPVSSNWAYDHVAASDPHTGYRLESADHTHQTTGLQAGKLDHGLALDGLSDDDHPQYIKHSLATAISDFLVASGAGAFVKKTLAEVKSLLDWAADIATHAALTTGIHGVGAGTIAKTADITATKLDDFAAPDNNTDLNVSITAHGLCPILSNVSTEYLSGTGVFSTPAGGGGGPTIVRKTLDETVNNSAVLQNDDHLLLAIAANEVWLIDLYLLQNSPSANSDVKMGWAYPSGCSIYWGVPLFYSTYNTGYLYWQSVLSTGALTAILTAASTESVASLIGTQGIHIIAIVINGATAGTLNFQWAQNTAVAENTKILANSCLIAHKLT